MKRYLFAIMALIVSGQFLLCQGKFSGLAYLDYYYNVARPSNQTGLPNMVASGPSAMQAFQIRRLFFTYDNDISNEFTTRFRLDADQSANTSDGRIGVFLKDAYVKWKEVFTGSDLTVGLQPTLPFEAIENVWEYRSIEKTISDLRGYITTRDMGISLRGSIDDGGTIGYGLLFGNNSGNKPATNKYKRYSGELTWRASQNFMVAVYSDFLDRSTISDPYHPGSLVSNGTLNIDGMVGYIEPDEYSAGVEVLSSTTSHGHDNAAKLSNLQGLGLSLYGWYAILEDISAIARIDYYDPNIDSGSKGDSRNYFIAGLSWKPNKNVSIIPNILYETYEKLPNGSSPNASLTARLTFYYVYL